MKALSLKRRHPAAFLILLLLGLLVTGMLYAGASAISQAQASTTPDGYTSGQVDEGERLFVANCATCHGMNAEGTDDGPSLVGVGAASVDFQVGTGRMPMQMSGPQAIDTDPVFNEANIPPSDTRDIMTYLQTLDTQGSPGGFSLGSLGPVPEGLLIWTLGLALVIASMVWLTSRAK